MCHVSSRSWRWAGRRSGRAVETVDVLRGSDDPHGFAFHDGQRHVCDAGIHPGWPNNDSPAAEWIFHIDFV